MSTLTEISNRLENPSNESDRMGAWAELTSIIEDNPQDEEAQELYDKHYLVWNPA